MSIRLRSFRLHLCYDIDPQGAKLTVDEPEVMRVRAIFELYLELKSIVAVLKELDRRGWVTKR